jgi:hypothetical protein
MFTDHIAKLPNLIVLCITPIWLNGKRPVSLCVDIDSVAAALTYQFKNPKRLATLRNPETRSFGDLRGFVQGFSHSQPYRPILRSGYPRTPTESGPPLPSQLFQLMTPGSRTLERPMAKSIVGAALFRSTILMLAGAPCAHGRLDSGGGERTGAFLRKDVSG